MDLKTILITGCGSGLGKASAIALARRGHKVYATTQYENESNYLNELAKKENLNLNSFKLDILSSDDRSLVKDIKVDVLINNCAINESGSISEIPVDKLRKVFETNIFSAIELTQIVLKNMIESSKGRVIFVSSILGIIPEPFLAPYSATKFALESLVMALRSELKKLKNKKIEVCLIEPGAYHTGFNQEMILKQYTWMKEKSYFLSQISKLRRSKLDKFNLIEEYNLNSIIRQYIMAVEDNECKKRYYAPKYQYLFAKVQQLLG